MPSRNRDFSGEDSERCFFVPAAALSIIPKATRRDTKRTSSTVGKRSKKVLCVREKLLLVGLSSSCRDELLERWVDG